MGPEPGTADLSGLTMDLPAGTLVDLATPIDLASPIANPE